MTDCLHCQHWEAAGVPAYAAAMGLAFCLRKQTKAVTLAHWRACEQWAPVANEAVDKRVDWLRRRGIEPRVSA